MNRFLTMQLRFIFLIFLIGCVFFLTLHFAIGKRIAQKESIRGQLDDIADCMLNKEFKEAYELMSALKKNLPEKTDNEPQEMQSLRYEIALKEALVDLKNGNLDNAAEMLELTLDQFNNRHEVLHESLRESYATALYYQAWNDRLDGLDREDWEPIADMARQQFKYLHEHNKKKDLAYARSVEAATRLYQMDLVELKGLPLPEEVQESQNKSQSGEKEEKKGKKPKDKNGKRPQQADIREKDKIETPGEAGVPDLQGS